MRALSTVSISMPTRRPMSDLIALVKDAAPDASLVILGPLDGARLPRFVKAPDKAQLPCRALSDDERANYDALVAAKDAKIAHWYTPPKLEAVRQTLEENRRAARRPLLGHVGGDGRSVQHRELGQGDATARICPTTCISATRARVVSAARSMRH